MKTASCAAVGLLAMVTGCLFLMNPVRAEGLAKPATRLGIDGTRFTVNGRLTFLLGASYYGALGAPAETIRRDLAALKKRHVNWIRVWATWSAFGTDVSAVDEEGRPRQPFFERLQRLVALCDEHGMVVDVTLSRGKGSAGPARLVTLKAHLRAVETLVLALKAHRNWYLDLANEHNIRDSRYTSFADLKVLRERVRQLDPNRLVTASHAGDINGADLKAYLFRVRVDFVSPHRPRLADSPGQTEAKSRKYLARMKELGRQVPLHYQEPFRRDYGDWQPRAEDFVTDLKGALAGGAAGWCWHNGANRSAKDGRPRRSFDLHQKQLFEQLDAEDRRTLRLLAALRLDMGPGIGPAPAEIPNGTRRRSGVIKTQ